MASQVVSYNTPQQLVDNALLKFSRSPAPYTLRYILDGVGLDLAVIQKINLKRDPKNDTPPPKGDFYAYVWNSDDEAKILKTKLADLAKLGLLVSVSKPVYIEMKSNDIRKARMAIKEFTRHNDKLGFDFSVPNNGYYASYSPQFKESAYGGEDGFLNKAKQFYIEAYERDPENNQALLATSNHFGQMSDKFKLNASSGKQAEFSIPNDISADRRIEGYMRQI